MSPHLRSNTQFKTKRVEKHMRPNTGAIVTWNECFYYETVYVYVINVDNKCIYQTCGKSTTERVQQNEYHFMYTYALVLQYESMARSANTRTQSCTAVDTDV